MGRRASGEGSIYRAKGQWVAQISVGPRSQRRYRRRYAATRSEASRRLAELQDEAQLGLTPSRLTVGAYLASWVSDARNIRETTRRGYASVVTYHLVPTIGGIKLVDLAPLHVERMLAELSGRMSPKSLRNVLVVLRRALHQAVRMGLVPRNVAGPEWVDTPRVTVSEPRSMTDDEVRRFLAAIKGDRLEALFVTALGTGLRQGELLGLAWEDVDGDVLHVRRALARREGRYVRDELKTTRSRRDVPLADPVRAALAAHREALVREGFVPTRSGPVFVTPTGGPLSGSWLTHHFYRLLEAASIPRMPFKQLRTTFGSRLYAAGVPDRTIADLLGHSRKATTQTHYIASRPDEAAAAVEKAL